MRKKLKDKDVDLADCRAEIDQRDHELVMKERVIAERDDVVSELQQQISRLNAELQSTVNNSLSAEVTSTFTDDTEVGN